MALAKRIVALSFVLALAACGGGDNGHDSSVSTRSLAFSAASPDAPTPAAQAFTASFGPDTVYVAVLHGGQAIGDVSHSLSGTTAQITVTPAAPASVGAGVFSGAVTVTGYGCANPSCSALVPGNTESVSVTFSIPSVVRYVAPYVAVASEPNTVIVRGRGFQAFAVQGVSFDSTSDSTQATTFTVVSDTEIHAEHPALTAGSYQVRVSAPTSPGPVTSTARLVAVAAPGYAATTLAYPAAVSQVHRLVYDAERQALVVTATDAVSGGVILRYRFTGGAWQSPESASVADLADVALTADGTQLLALSQSALTQLDPETLTAGTATPAPVLDAGVFLKNFAVANDGNAIVTTGAGASATTPLFAYDPRGAAFSQPATTPRLDRSTPAAAGDGSTVALVQGDPALTSALPVYRYLASTATFSAAPLSLNQNAVAPALDRRATRLVLNGTNVYDATYTLLGTLPATTLAVVVRPDGSRAYTYDSASAQLLAFDLTTSQSGGPFPQAGPAVPAGDPGSGVKMAISPDGGTLFLAGSNGIVVRLSP
jgi:hypothetical protein